MDTIGDFFTRIRNASLAGHEKVDVPSSNVRVGIAEVLKETGYIRNFKVVRDTKQGVMRVYLNYRDGKPAIQELERVSRPGRRMYVNSGEIPNVRNGFGTAILSTNKGILSGRQAKEMNVGGELIGTIW